MLFWISALLITLVLLLSSFGLWTERLMLASTWLCVLRFECEFRGWVEEGHGKISWLDWAMEPEKCKLESFATSKMFPAGDDQTQSWTSLLLWTSCITEFARLACTRHLWWWFCHQLSFLKGCSSFMLAIFFLKLQFFHFLQLSLWFTFRMLSSNAQLCVMLFLNLFPFSSWYFKFSLTLTWSFSGKSCVNLILNGQRHTSLLSLCLGPIWFTPKQQQWTRQFS